MRCNRPECGAENPAFATKCLRCGHDLRAPTGGHTAPTPQSPQSVDGTAQLIAGADWITRLLNDPRQRSIVAGAVGGLLGWVVAEVLCGRPQSFLSTLSFGLLAGAGIGVVLSIAEGLVIRSRALIRRGSVIGLIVGMVGGAVGAGFGQLGFAATSAATQTRGGNAPTSVFSAEMRKRLQEAGAKSGEVEIALIWQNRNDLDLHVIDPAGERIFFQHRVSASGGELDVDRNAACAQDMTDQPVEHVVWPAGRAPMGNYQVFVHHYQNCGRSDPTSFRVELLVDGKHEEFTGSVSHSNPPKLVHSFTRSPGQPVEVTATEGPNLGSMIARILGWTIFGALVGSAVGLTRKSTTSLRNASIGGGIGGGLGGVAFELLARVLLPLGIGDVWSRLVGLVVLGACIGLWIVIIERALSAVLSVLSGRQEGRQIVLDRPRMRVGRSDALEVYLGTDSEVLPHHATIQVEGGEHVVLPEAGPVSVNGSSTTRHSLKDGDVLQLGRTKLRYSARKLGTLR